MAFSAGRKTQLALRATTTRKYGAFTAKNLDKTLDLTAIASAEAFGTITLSSPRATFGGKTRLGLNGVSREVHTLLGAHTGNLALTGIPSAETIGSHQIIGGTVVLMPTGIASAEAFGTQSLVQIILPTGLSSAESFGATAVAPLGTVIPTAIGDGQKLATWTANTEPDLAGYRVYVALSTMASTIPAGTRIYDVGNTTGYVIANLTSGTTYFVAISAYDTSNNESALSAEQSFVATAGIRFGDVNVIGNRVLAPTGLTTAETFGTTVVTPGGVTLLPLGIATANAFGAHFVLSGTGQFVGGIGIDSAEAFGTLSFGTGGIILNLTGIPSSETFGTQDVFATLNIANLGGIASAEAIGIALVNTGGNQIVRLIALPSEEAFGVIELDLFITLTGLASAEAFGATAVGWLLEPTAIGSLESFGAHTLIPGNVNVNPSSILTLEGFGTHLLVPEDQQLPVRVFQARTRTFTFTSAR